MHSESGTGMHMPTWQIYALYLSMLRELTAATVANPCKQHVDG